MKIVEAKKRCDELRESEGYDLVVRLRFKREENAERCAVIIHDLFGSDFIWSKIEPVKENEK